MSKTRRSKPSSSHARRGAGSRRRPAKRPSGAHQRTPSPIEVREVESLRSELERVAGAARPPRWNAEPEEVRRSVAKLVLTLVELIRQLLERQALRRVDAGTLTAEETEAVGLALMRLEQTVREIGVQFDLAQEDLNLDLGPVGKLI